MKKGVVGLSLQEIMTYTAHQAHQQDMLAHQRAQAASGCLPGDYSEDESKESPQVKQIEGLMGMGEGDGF